MPDVTIGAQFPGEGLAIAICSLLEKLIDGQTPEQKAKLWQEWIDFWGPMVKGITGGKP